MYADRLPAQFQGKSLDGLPSSSSVTKSGWNCWGTVRRARCILLASWQLVRLGSAGFVTPVVEPGVPFFIERCGNQHRIVAEVIFTVTPYAYPEDAPYGLWGKVSDVPATDVRQDTIETPFAVWARPDLRVDIHGLCGYRQHLFPLIQLLVDRDFDLIT